MLPRVYKILLLQLMVTAAWAASPVWQVSDGQHTLYIGGTVHVLAPSDYPLPAAFNEAYQQADVLVFETDMAAMQGLEFQAAMLQAMMYDDGRTLKTELSTATFNALSEFSASRGLPIEGLIGFKPAMVMMTLTLVELNRLGISGAGVDAYFYTKAVADKKGLDQLESVESQLAFVAGMGEGREDEFVNYSLNDMKNLADVMRQLKSAWVVGDLDQLKHIALLPLKSDFPEIYQQLIVKRNNAWMKSIEAMLTTEPTELVLVGALHLVGDVGLLEQLAKKGYRVKRLE